MNDIIIMGSGGFAKEVYSIIKSINAAGPVWNLLGFTSNDKIEKPVIDEILIIGDNSYLDEYNRNINVVIAIGDPRIRKDLYNFLCTKQNINFPNVVHPTTQYDSQNTYFGIGNIVAANVIISPYVKIGNLNILNMGCILAHDSTISNYCTINPASNISGNVKIGNNCTIGSSSVVLQGINIANNTILGIGSVLTRDTTVNSTYFGIPAKKIG